MVAAIVLALLALSTTLAASQQQIQEDEPHQENQRILDALQRNLSASDNEHQWYGSRSYKHALTNILESVNTNKGEKVERGYSAENILDAFQQAKDNHYPPNGNDKGNGYNKKPTSPRSSKGKKHKTSKQLKGGGKKGGSKPNKSSSIYGISTGGKNYPAPIQTRRVPNVVLSYVLPAGTVRTDSSPTYTDYAILAQITAEWFEQAVRGQLVSDDMFLLSVDAKLDFAASNEGNPEPRFNAMIVYDYVEYIYYVTTKAASNAPSRAELDAVMRDSITAEYVLNAVRTVEAFAAASEVFYQTTGRPLPPPPPSISPPISPPPPTASPGTLPPTVLEPFEPPGPISDATNAVLVGPFYIAYVNEDALVEPTQEQYDQQVAVTVDYFNAVIDQGLRERELPGIFYGSEAAIGSIVFGGGCPEERFNIFMVYDSLTLYFAANDQTDIELFNEAVERLSVEGFQVLQDAITVEFITDVIWSVEAFSSVHEVVLKDGVECLPDTI